MLRLARRQAIHVQKKYYLKIAPLNYWKWRHNYLIEDILEQNLYFCVRKELRTAFGTFNFHWDIHGVTRKLSRSRTKDSSDLMIVFSDKQRLLLSTYSEMDPMWHLSWEYYTNVCCFDLRTKATKQNSKIK